MGQLKQHEIRMPELSLKAEPCGRVKFINNQGTTVRCLGTVIFQRSIDDRFQIGKCGKCSHRHARRSNAV